MDSDSEEWEAAKTELRAAITAFYHKVDPGAFISEWALVTHKESISMNEENESMVSYLVPTGQSFHHTVGLLITASDHARSNSRYE